MKSGDPVTIAVMMNEWLCAAHARVGAFYESASRCGFYFVAGVVIVGRGNVTIPIGGARATGRFIDEEGVTWIHGHQTGDAVIALLAAAALDVGAVPLESFNDFDDYLDDDDPAYKDDAP
jgi:hypothetical protein